MPHIVIHQNNSIHLSTNNANIALNYVANKYDPLFKGHKIGVRAAQNILERDPSRAMQYIEEWQNRDAQHQRMSTYAPDVQKNINKLEMRGDKIMEGYKNVELGKLNKEDVIDNTDQFKEQMQDKHFKDFDVNGDYIKNEYNSRKDSADQKILDQKIDINQESRRIKKEVDKAEDNKGMVAKFFGVGRKNPNKGHDEDK